MNIQNRKGKFFIHQDLVRNFIEDERYGVLQEALSKVLIVEAYSSFLSNSIEYLGYSELFEEIPEGSEPKLYQALFRTISNGENVDIVFEGFVQYND